MHPTDLQISDYTYHLPEERIAGFPLPERDQSKLLVCRNNLITEDTFTNLALHLPPSTLLVFNNTRVIPARVLFQKSSGSTIELFCLEPATPSADLATALQCQGPVQWKCMIGGASKWKKGQTLKKTIQLDDGEMVLSANLLEKLTDCFVVVFSWLPASRSFSEVLHHAGQVPLPPYLHRPVHAADAERYQTVFAQHEGSVAAPTAGLHFTPQLLGKLEAAGANIAYITLHVGAGTFKPVKAATLGGHDMHAEYLEVRADLLRLLIGYRGTSIIPIGTTSLRSLESFYWLGIKTLADPQISEKDLTVHQWDPYAVPAPGATRNESLQSLLDWMNRHDLEIFFTKTQLLIVPGYPFKLTDALVTNFHQPQSTLLLLVAALAGNAWRTAYQYALEHDFRFLSYGDGCLLFPQQPVAMQ